MSSVADDLAMSRRYGRLAGIWNVVLIAVVASVLALAVWDGLWPPRAKTQTQAHSQGAG
jgi:hypothetical protein